MIPGVSKSLCTGCSACQQVCPKNCISMIENEEGFLYPTINNDLCVNCGVCSKTCPIINMKCVGEEVISAYACYCKNEEIREKSSSGGLFTVIAQHILNQQGVVFGASFDDFFNVCHTYIESEAELYKLQGSKYVQSRIGNSYKLVKEFLDNNRKVLFVGTPCQIAGLKSYLRDDYENLVTIGILCHGVPSPKFWRHYLSELEKKKGSTVQQVYFRNKSTGWKVYSVNIKFQDIDEYRSIFKHNEYMKLFLDNICLRPSCHNCRFKSINRPSDITLGDCWKIDKYMPEMDDDKGTSVVLIHSVKGEKIFNSLKEQLVFKQGDLDKLMQGATDALKSANKHHNREKFFKKLNKGKSISALLKLLKPSLIVRIKYKIRKPISKIKHLVLNKSEG